MSDTPQDALVAALKAIADGQKELLTEIKKMSSQDLVPIKMPDGSTQLVPRSNLQASTQGQNTGRLSLIEHQPITKEPWPDPNQPKPPVVR